MLGMADTDEVKKVYILKEGEHTRLHFYCPGCECNHGVYVDGPRGPKPVWQWNKSETAPTLVPSLLIKGQHRCHLFVRNGRIEFLKDCNHKMAGLTVEMHDV